MAFPQVYSISGMLIEVQSLVLVLSRRVVSSLNGVLNIIQQHVEVIALTTVIGMGVVASLSKVLVSGITKAIYTTVIRDAGVFTDVNLKKNKLLYLIVECISHVFMNLAPLC